MMGNGQGPAIPTKEQVDQANAILASVQPGINTTVNVMLRGLIASAPGVRPDLVLSMFCFEVGQAAGKALVGDMAQLLQIRKTCKDAFDEGLRKAPPQPAPLAHGAPLPVS